MIPLAKNVPFKTYLRVFDTQIRPILEYGSEVWYGGHAIKKIENVHITFLKQIMGVKTQTSSLTVYGETGRYPLELRQKEMAVKYWVRLIQLNDNDPLKHIYKELLRVHISGGNTWCKTVMSVLHSIDHINLWEAHIDGVETISVKPLLSKLKVTLEQQYKSTWYSDICDSVKHPVLRTYKLFKNSHHVETYLLSVKNAGHRKNITRFRVSSHDLEIEKGRHCRPKIPASDRLCKFCSANAVDDELHLLTSCVYHDVERDILYQCVLQYITNLMFMDDRLAFISILQTENQHILAALGSFLSAAFQKRKLHRAV